MDAFEEINSMLLNLNIFNNLPKKSSKEKNKNLKKLSITNALLTQFSEFTPVNFEVLKEIEEKQMV